MSITNKLNQIKNAIYGKEVRGAIHDAIKQVYDDASVNRDNANMEVKMARGTHNTLNDRLDNVDEIQAQTNAQLSRTISKGEGGVVTMQMLSQQVKENMVGGSVAVVGLDAVLEANVVDGQITARKTSFIDTETVNLLKLENDEISADDLTIVVTNDIVILNGKTGINEYRLKLSNGISLIKGKDVGGWVNESVDFMNINKIYCVSQYELSGSYSTTSPYAPVISVRNNQSESIASPSRNPATLTTAACYVQFFIPENTTFNDYRIKFVVEENNKATDLKNVDKYILRDNIQINELTDSRKNFDGSEYDSLGHNLRTNFKRISDFSDKTKKSIQLYDSLLTAINKKGITIKSNRIENLLDSIHDFYYKETDCSIKIEDGVIRISGVLNKHTYIKLTNGIDVSVGASGGDKREYWSQEIFEAETGVNYSLKTHIIDGSATIVDGPIASSARNSHYTSLLSDSKGLTTLNDEISYIQVYLPPGQYDGVKIGVILQQCELSTEYTPDGYVRTSVDINTRSNSIDYPTQFDYQLFKNLPKGSKYNIQGLCCDGDYIYAGILVNSTDNENTLLLKIDIKTRDIVQEAESYSLGHCNSMTYCDYDGYIHCVNLSDDGKIHRITTDLEYVDFYYINISEEYPQSTGVGAVEYNADTKEFIYLIRGDKKGYAIFSKNKTFKRIVWAENAGGHVYGGFCVEDGLIYQAVWGNTSETHGTIAVFELSTGKMLTKYSMIDFPDEIEELTIYKDKLLCSAIKLTYTESNIYEVHKKNFLGTIG